MCLGIPARILRIADAERQLAVVEVSGVERAVNVICVAEPGRPLEDLLGAWVLLHAGFAMSLIDEAEAAKTLEVLKALGEMEDELAVMQQSGSP
jgi:hydrogenase expression/formation protein HypC